MNFQHFASILAVPFSCVACSLLLCSCGGKKSPDAGPVARPVKIMAVSDAGVSATVEYPGKISALNQADMSFDVPGKLVELPVVESQAVKSGQLLARLDERDYQSALDAETAQLVSARAEYERSQKLFDDGTVSRRDFDLAKSAFEVADARVKSARKALDDTRLLAPFDGRVARVMINNFEAVDAKKTVMLVQDCRKLEIKVNVPEKDFVLKSGSADLDKAGACYRPVVVLSSLPGREIPAVISEAALSADPVTRTFEVTMVFDAPQDVTILPGMTAKVVVSVPMAGLKPGGAGGGTVVPVQAVFSDKAGKSFVWVVGSDMRVSRREVSTGDMSGGGIVITGGISVGEEIAVSGVQYLEDKMAVRRFARGQ